MYDLVIIGSGPGGYEAVLTAVRKGLKVALVEKDKLGGNCLNRACIPTKYYAAGSHIIEKLPFFKRYGIEIENRGVSFKDAYEGKNEVIYRLRKSFLKLLKTAKVDTIKGKGFITGEKEVLVKGKEEKILKTKYILIATGSKPTKLGNLTPDNEYILTTDYFMEDLDKLPDRLLIVGGGVSGCEIASIARRYGSKVHVVELQDRLLPSPSVSRFISNMLLKKFKKLRIEVHLKTSVKDVEKTNNGLRVILSNGEVIEVDKILLSVGRVPNSEVDNLGIQKDERGFIKVNQYLQTNYPNIYAVGDVINTPMLAYTAQHEAKVALYNILNPNKKKTPIYEPLPFAIFSAYEIGYVGENEDTAKEKGIEIEVGQYTYTFNEKAADEFETDGVVKLIFEKSSKKLIGGYIVGYNASELIHEIQLMIKAGYTVEEVHEHIYFHPSYSELLTFASYDIAVGKLF